MNFAIVLQAVLSLLAGVGVFLVACKTMSTNLESVSSNKLKALFAGSSKNQLLGVGIGAAGTALIQSSGATTVMVIGFVNAGIMSLSQAAAVIYGANIGTTVTGQIVALGLFSSSTLSTTLIFSAFAGLGAVVSLFAKKDSLKRICGILAGFGMLFIGISMMSSAMEIFAADETVKSFIASISNPFLLLLLGLFLTALVQSSSVMTSIAIAMAVSGLITTGQGIYLIMGSNIGACVVALLAGLSGTKNAKRTALMPLIFNLFGALVFLGIEGILFLAFGENGTYASLFARLFPDLPQTQLAMFHTAFNLGKTLLFLPLTKALVALVKKLVPGKDRADEEAPHFYFVDENLLRTPAVAVGQVKNEILNMAKIALDNFVISCDIAATLDYSKEEDFRRSERELNFLNRELVVFIQKVADHNISEKDRRYLSSAYRTVADLERVGDYAENIIEYADELKKHGEHFSESAVREIKEVRDLVVCLSEHTVNAYKDGNKEEISIAEIFEEQVDELTDRMAENHVTRLDRGACTPNAGAQYLSLASDAERVADHFMNMANATKYFS
ncbi:MAG: Na/Pi cotransporter family protein [Clostridia bacterium]|nr:Na/Pi cotransporter family protein [Clostridia bacterium]